MTGKLSASAFNFDNIANWSKDEVTRRDTRGYSMLMVAAEAGKEDAVKQLINRGENLDFEVGGHTAASLAFTKGYHSVVLLLLKSNAKYPFNYRNEDASDELKAFVELSEGMHREVNNDSLRDNDEHFERTKKSLKQKFNDNPGVRHFYNTSNVSLGRPVVLSRFFKLYEFLLTCNIFLGVHEGISDINFNSTESETIRGMHGKYSLKIYNDAMETIMRNCKFGLDNRDDSAYSEFVRKLLVYLFEFPLIAIVLKIVAARREFEIIFDFNRDSVDFQDPSADSSTEGLFYFTGNIYIAAKDCLDPDKFFSVAGVLAHELCHFAMFLVFDNVAKPYRVSDTVLRRRFEEILKYCEKNQHRDKVIGWVYSSYELSMRHAELIVRVVHILALRGNFPLAFKSLRDYYEEICVPTMQNQLLDIQKKFDPNPKIEGAIKDVAILKNEMVIIQNEIKERETKKKEARERKRMKKEIKEKDKRKIKKFFIVFYVVVFAGIIFSEIPYSWSKLGENQRFIIETTIVDFHGVDLKFGELFANDSIVYKELSSWQIIQTLYISSNALSKVVNSSNHLIYLTFPNMTEGLKNHFVTLKVNFQGHNVALNEILTNFSVLNSLSVQQIRDVFDGKLNVSTPIKLNAKFYLERSWNEIKSEIPNLEENNSSKMRLLSSLAGEGKSIALTAMAIKIKQNSPTKWVQFVILRKYFKVLEEGEKIDFGQPHNFIQFLSEKFFNFDSLEREIFIELFKSGQVVFLWDGFNEILPAFNDSITKIIEKVLATNNFQYISSRPKYTSEIKQKFNIGHWEIAPLTHIEIREFLTKFILSENYDLNADEIRHNVDNNEDITPYLSPSQLSEIVKKRNKILYSVEAANDRLLSSPLLLKMITENFDLITFFNIYDIFDIFIYKKVESALQNGKGEQRDVLNKNNNYLNIMQVHQAYALKNEFLDFDEQFNLEIMKKISIVESHIISKVGIIEITSENNFTFSHQMYVEFLIAKFFIENIDNIDVERDNIDAETKVLLLFGILFMPDSEVIKSFLVAYLKTGKKIPKVFQYLIQNNCQLNWDDTSSELKAFFTFIKFFKSNYGINIFKIVNKEGKIWLNIFSAGFSLFESFF